MTAATKNPTYRDLIEVVYNDFAISVTEIAEQLDAPKDKIRDALQSFPGVFCGDMQEDGPGGLTDTGRGESRQSKGQYGSVIWQCWKTYDDNELSEVVDSAVEQGVFLDKKIGD
jgi:hypothetical protein